MGPFSTVMAYYPYVFHPITVLGVGFLVLIYYEWDRQGGDRAALYRRAGAFLGAGLLALVPSAVYFLGPGESVVEATQGNAWQVDALVASGLLIAAGITWYVWRRYELGHLVAGAMVALTGVTVPYAVLSPFWNVSGHVIISLMPTLYLALVDRRFWPLLVVPAIMVPNRIVLDAHTWPQALWAIPFTALVVTVVYWETVDGAARRAREAATA